MKSSRRGSCMTSSKRQRRPAVSSSAVSIPESRGSSSRCQTTHRSAITPLANARCATASRTQTPAARAVFAADKIAKARELALLPSGQLSQPKNRAKLDHYCASLEMLRRVDGDVPLVHRLVDELSGLAARKVTAPIVAGPSTGLPEAQST